MAAPPQADGYYPRVNAEQVVSGRFASQLVSLVGKFTAPPDAEQGLVQFTCCDAGTIRLDVQHADVPANAYDGTSVYEVVGQCMDGDLVAMFVTRELSPDMDLAVYNKMILVQHNPKFQHYFVPGDSTNNMVTN